MKVALLMMKLFLELFKNNLDLDSCNYILDGFPRTIEQCEMLDDQVLKMAVIR